MAPIRAFAAMLLAGAALVAMPACARECAPTLLPVAMPMTAGFGRIENRCPTPVTIVGASSAAFDDVSLHETRVIDGVSRMRAVPELVVPANGTMTLQPGGLHLMLMQPRAPLQAGRRIEIDFALKGGGTLRGELVVRAPGKRAPTRRRGAVGNAGVVEPPHGPSEQAVLVDRLWRADVS